ncbi:GNAT family N-acetyltransferase [Microvirga tunisiensis]|uniref:GNAT family N-acetyltransferase n=1 Tax=Microvirga tunisiensis TaxID=2108360 RepID=A0A5N7MG24_9HYPH|nr:GNAT family N-acetyltransferase [Microvirga tunisiensis]MPR07506.1 GNAT family N-acetyltransferase [Microvirga tunisiensis]MPR25773.1 GNAT family N-acetyltransferase [Microvirga tunisiensis]
MTGTFLYTSPDDERSRPLVEALTHEYATRYGTYFGDEPGAEMRRYPAALLAPPEGNFVLLLRNGMAIAGGAFKRYDEHTADLKRIWTHENYRRQGLARRVVLELEAQALRQHYTSIYLTTGFRQPEAKGLYLSMGYTPLFDMNLDPEIYKILPFKKDLLPKVVTLASRREPARSEAPQGAI